MNQVLAKELLFDVMYVQVKRLGLKAEASWLRSFPA